ncbi:MAG: TonB-dependent receptor, partial [Novosphingobium sp.]|nr:TonB-dependent receptor [Novosphingobium sp.]
MTLIEKRRKRLRLAAMLGATAMTAPFLTAPALAAEEGAGNVIIVTANRREEALEEVPASVTVVSPETLAAAGLNNVRDLQNVTSGFQLGNSGSIPQAAIRGVTTTNAGSYENNVAVYFDGVYQVVPASLNIDIPNFESIQILKGPQGTLYGRNATGGAILVQTVNPGDEWVGKAEVTYARFDDKRIGGYIAGPLTDRVGMSISTYFRKTDGWVKKASRTVAGGFDGRTFGIEQASIRGKLLFDLTDNFTAKLGYAYTRVSDPNAMNFTQIENVRVDPATVPGANTTATGLGETSFNLQPEIQVEQHEAFLDLNLETGFGSIRSLSAYTTADLTQVFDFDGSYIQSTYSQSRSREKTYQQTLEFAVTSIDRLDLLIGGQYFQNTTSFPNPSDFNLGPGTFSASRATDTPISQYTNYLHSDFDRKKEAWAAYFDATFAATDRLFINVGGRYTQETQDVRSQRFSAFFPPFNPAGPVWDSDVFAASSGVPFSSKYKRFTPRASIRYEISPRTSVYASYSRGFRSGEWNTAPPAIGGGLVALFNEWAPVAPEKIDAFEVGVKSAGGRLRWDVAAFYYDYKSLQVSQTTSDSNGNPIVLLQTGPARIYGVEGSFDFEVVENFNIHGGATWLNARYANGFTYTGIGVNPNQQGFNTNSDPLKTLFNTGVNQDLSGLQMARAPDFTAFLGFDYLIPDGDGGFLFAVNAKYTSSYVPTDPSIWGGDPTWNPDGSLGPIDNFELLNGTAYESRSEEQRTREGGYVLLNASVTWTNPTDNYYVRAWGKNLTDERYRIHYRPLGTGGTYQPMAEPRTYGLTVGVKFAGGNEAPPPPPPAPPPPP